MRSKQYCESHVLMIVPYRSWKRLWLARYQFWCSECERTVTEPVWRDDLEAAIGCILAIIVIVLRITGVI